MTRVKLANLTCRVAHRGTLHWEEEKNKKFFQNTRHSSYPYVYLLLSDKTICKEIKFYRTEVILLNHIYLLCFYRFRQQRYHSFFG